MSEQTKSKLSFRPEVLAMQGYKSGEQPRGGKFIKLNTNENPYPCSHRVVEAIKSAADGGLQKYPDATALSFRMTVARQLGVDPEMILCGNGSDEILTMVTRAFVGPGEVIRWPYPTYVLYPVLTEIQGAKCEPIHFAPGWKLPNAFFEASDDLSLVFLANPNSPSGTLIDKQQIVRLADALPCPLLIDEAYADFAGSSCVDLDPTTRADPGFEDAQQILRAGWFTIRLPGGSKACDSTTEQSSRQLQLRCAFHRGRDCRHRRSKLVATECRDHLPDATSTGRPSGPAWILRHAFACQFLVVPTSQC